MPIDYGGARELLDTLLVDVENDLLTGRNPTAPEGTEDPFEIVFASATQAYREALVGCCIARVQDKQIAIRLPYMNQGEGAFNGRTLDERVVNPFLQANRIPSSRGPYLGVFRRSVRFDLSTRTGVRDKSGYDAFLELISHLEETGDEGILSLLPATSCTNSLLLAKRTQFPCPDCIESASNNMTDSFP